MATLEGFLWALTSPILIVALDALDVADSAAVEAEGLSMA